LTKDLTASAEGAAAAAAPRLAIASVALAANSFGHIFRNSAFEE